MHRAVPRRRAEFAAGRTCARRALAALGVHQRAIPSGTNRLPQWPDGYIGSITHTETVCAAAVGRYTDGFIAVGIDLEPAVPLPAEVVDAVCLPAELAWLEMEGGCERHQGELARAIFSAKECAFKCQYPLSHTLIGFHDLAVALDLRAGIFRARFVHGVPAFASDAELEGRLHMDRDLIACAMTLTST